MQRRDDLIYLVGFLIVLVIVMSFVMLGTGIGVGWAIRRYTFTCDSCDLMPTNSPMMMT